MFNSTSCAQAIAQTQTLAAILVFILLFLLWPSSPFFPTPQGEERSLFLRSQGMGAPQWLLGEPSEQWYGHNGTVPRARGSCALESWRGGERRTHPLTGMGKSNIWGHAYSYSKILP